MSCCPAGHNLSVKRDVKTYFEDDLRVSWEKGQSVKERTGIVQTRYRHATSMALAVIYTADGHPDTPKIWKLNVYSA